MTGYKLTLSNQMARKSAFRLFVDDIGQQRKKDKKRVIWSKLYVELNPVWRNMPDVVKDTYVNHKLRSKSTSRVNGINQSNGVDNSQPDVVKTGQSFAPNRRLAFPAEYLEELEEWEETERMWAHIAAEHRRTH